MKRLFGLLLIAIMLPGGCVSGDGANLNVQHVPVYLDRPVACVPADKIPARPGALPARPADARQGEAVAVAKVREWEGYGDHADPLLRACAKQP